MVGINEIGEQGKIAAWWIEGESKSIFRVSILFRLQDTRKNSSVLFCYGLVGGKKWVLRLCKAIMFYSSFGSGHSCGMWGEWCQLFHLSWSKCYWTFMLCLTLGKPSGRSPGSWPRALEIRSLLRQAASVWMWREGAGIWAPAWVQRVALPP